MRDSTDDDRVAKSYEYYDHVVTKSMCDDIDRMMLSHSNDERPFFNTYYGLFDDHSNMPDKEALRNVTTPVLTFVMKEMNKWPKNYASMYREEIVNHLLRTYGLRLAEEDHARATKSLMDHIRGSGSE